MEMRLNSLRIVTLATAMGTALLSGCGKEEPATPTTAPSAPVVLPAPSTQPVTTQPLVVPPVTTRPATMPATAPATQATQAAATAADNVQAIAQTLIAQASQYIADNKLTEAQNAISKLQEIKAQLPADWQTRIDQLQTSLTARKQTNDLLKGFGK